jgi:hypothetical protein
MAILPTGYVVGTRGVYNATPTEDLGGVALGITDGTIVTAGRPVTQTFSIVSNLTNTGNRRSVPIQASGTAHTYSAQRAMNTGTFAFSNPSGYIVRGVSTTINGTASTAMLINGNEMFRLRRDSKLKSWGYKYSTAIRAGHFRFTKISGQRTNWSTAPSALNETFRSTTNNAVDAVDQSAFVTYRSVPGELVYLQGGLAPFLDDYKAQNG